MGELLEFAFLTPLLRLCIGEVDSPTSANDDCNSAQAEVARDLLESLPTFFLCSPALRCLGTDLEEVVFSLRVCMLLILALKIALFGIKYSM